MTRNNHAPLRIIASAVIGLVAAITLLGGRAAEVRSFIAPSTPPDHVASADGAALLPAPSPSGSLAPIEPELAAGDSDATFAALEPITVAEVMPFWPKLEGKLLERPTAHDDVPRVQGYSCLADGESEKVMDAVQASLEKAGWQDLSRHGTADPTDRYGLQLAGKRDGYLTMAILRRIPMGRDKTPLMLSVTVFRNSQLDRGISGAFTLPIPRALAFQCIDRLPPRQAARGT